MKGEREASGALRSVHMFEWVHGRPALEALLATAVPDSQYEPGDVHEKLVRLPWSDIFTTNWDTLLERAVDLYDRSYDIVTSTKDISRTRAPRIVKLHGTLGASGFLIFTHLNYEEYPHTQSPFHSIVHHTITQN